jgi:CheY-like chemotaxis protein
MITPALLRGRVRLLLLIAAMTMSALAVAGGSSSALLIFARSGTNLPIPALTAHGMPGDVEICLAAGMDRWLSQPLKPRKLEAAINQLLSM